MAISANMWWTVLGAGLAIIGCIFQAIGFVVEKIGHNKVLEYNMSLAPQDGKVKKKKYTSSKIWLFGFFLNGVVGSLLNIAALNYAPQSIVLPLSATTLVGNTIFATKWLNEPFHIQDFIGILLVIFGSISAIIFGPKEIHNDNNALTIDNLSSYWSNNNFLSFFILLTSIVVADLILLKVLTKINRMKRTSTMLTSSIIMNHIDDVGDDDHVIDIDHDDVSTNSTTTNQLIVYFPCFFLLSYPFIAAYFASISFLFLKSLVKILSSSFISLHNFYSNFSHWLTYLYLFLVIISNFLLEMYRQKGLKSFGAVYVIPIYQVLLITMGTTMGAIYFDEMKNVSQRNFNIFCISVFITSIGVVIISLSQKINECRAKYNKNGNNVNIDNNVEYSLKKTARGRSLQINN